MRLLGTYDKIEIAFAVESKYLMFVSSVLPFRRKACKTQACV